MSAATETRLEVLRELRDEVLHNYGSGRPIVAIDGVDGAGTAAFADDLAAVFAEVGHAVVRASAAGFPASGADAAGGSVMLDEPSFRSALVVPFRAGGDSAFRTAAGAGPETAPADAVLLLDGAYLHSPELVGIWNYSVFLEVPSLTASDAQRRYLAAVRPRTRAIAIVDNSDVDAPVRRFADSC